MPWTTTWSRVVAPGGEGRLGLHWVHRLSRALALKKRSASTRLTIAPGVASDLPARWGSPPHKAVNLRSTVTQFECNGFRNRTPMPACAQRLYEAIEKMEKLLIICRKGDSTFHACMTSHLAGGWATFKTYFFPLGSHFNVQTELKSAIDWSISIKVTVVSYLSLLLVHPRLNRSIVNVYWIQTSFCIFNKNLFALYWPPNGEFAMFFTVELNQVSHCGYLLHVLLHCEHS